jgi:hypothetical protein
MLLEKLKLAAIHQEVLAALYAYDIDGQRRFRESRQIKKSDWRRAMSALASLGLATAHGTLTEAGKEWAHRLPKKIWSDI